MAIPLSAYKDYRFVYGSVDDLMEVAYLERRETNHITCKCCGRRIMTTQQCLETLYTCGKPCYQKIARILTESPQRAAAGAAN